MDTSTCLVSSSATVLRKYGVAASSASMIFSKTAVRILLVCPVNPFCRDPRQASSLLEATDPEVTLALARGIRAWQPALPEKCFSRDQPVDMSHMMWR